MYKFLENIYINGIKIDIKNDVEVDVKEVKNKHIDLKDIIIKEEEIECLEEA